MWDTIIGAGISAAGKLWGANQDQKNADKQFEKNAALQREFAQNGVKWRVEDAKAAGIHPAFALGAQVASASPVSVGSTSMADVMGSVGQDISRALSATSNQRERVSSFEATVQRLTLQKLGLENEFLAAQIGKLRTNPNPPMPNGQRLWLDGQGQTELSAGSPSGVPGTQLVNTVPMERNASSPTQQWMEPGAVADVGHARTATGLRPVMSEDVKKRMEDDMLGMISWNINNRLYPSFGLNSNPPDAPLPPGYRWIFNPWMMEYQPMKKDGPFGRYVPLPYKERR